MYRITEREALNLAFRVNRDTSSQTTLQWSLWAVLESITSLDTGPKLLGKVQTVLKRMRSTLNSQSVVCAESGREECLMICFKHFLRMSNPVLTKVSIDRMDLITPRSSGVFGKFLANTHTVTHIKIEADYWGIRSCLHFLQALLLCHGSTVLEVLKINLNDPLGWNVDRIAYLLQKVRQQGAFTPPMLMFYSKAPTQAFNVARLFPDVFYSWLSTPEEKLRGHEKSLFGRYLLQHFNRLGGLDQL